MRRFLRWAALLAGSGLLLFFVVPDRGRVVRGENDFVSFYSGAALAGTPHLYSREASTALMKAHIGYALEGVTYIRAPFHAALLKPLAGLPYHAAYALFTLLTFGSLAWFVWRFSRDCPPFRYFSFFSVPAIIALANGQDTPLLLLFFGGAILLLRRQQPWAAGLLLSLCAIKFHLFLPVPLALVLRRQWRVLGGLACGGIALLTLGAMVNGPASYRDWLRVLRDPWIQPNPQISPNFHGLAQSLGAGAWLEVLLAAVAVLTFLWITHRSPGVELPLAAGVVCGLLVSFHAYVADCLLIYPALLLAHGRTASRLLPPLSALLFTPIPFLLLQAGSPANALLPATLLLFLAGLAWALSPARAPGSLLVQRQRQEVLVDDHLLL